MIWRDISQIANMYMKLLHPTDPWGNANQNQSYIILPTRIVIIKKTKKCWQRRGERGLLLHCWWGCKLVRPLWKTEWRCLKTWTSSHVTWQSCLWVCIQHRWSYHVADTALTFSWQCCLEKHRINMAVQWWMNRYGKCGINTQWNIIQQRGERT